MPDSLLTMSQTVVDMATAAGADDAFVSASKNRSVEFSVREGEVETVKEATSKSLSVKLWVDGRYGAHSTNDLREESLRSFIREAVALTRAVQADPNRAITDPALFEGQSDLDLDLFDPAIQNLTRDNRLSYCMDQNEALQGHEGVISVSSSASDNVGESAMASSNGFSGETRSSSLWMGSDVTFSDGPDKKPESWMWAGGRHLSQLPTPQSIAEIALKRGRDRLGSTKGPTKKGLMIVDPAISGSLISRLLSPARGALLSQGRSFWAGKIGEQTVSEKLTIIDDPLIPSGFGSRLFDAEGIAAKSMPIIEEGVLRNLYLSTYYGKKLEMAPTTGGSSNLVLKPGARALASIIADTPEAIYVTSWLGGNSDSTSGDFSLGLRGHLIKDGVIGAPVGEMNITGNLLTLFSGLVEVGNDPWPYSARLVPTLVFDGVGFSGA